MLSPYRRQNSALQKAAKAAVYAAAGYKAGPTASQIKKVYSTVKYAKNAMSKNSAPAQPLHGRKTGTKRPKRKAKLNRKTMDRVVKQVKELKQSESAALGTQTTRNLYSARITSSANEQEVSLVSNPLSKTVIESVLSTMKFFNPATPGTLTTASGVAGTYQRNILLKSITSKLLLRNNYKSDVDVKVYLCKCKDDTNISSLQTWINSVPDGSNLTSVQALGQYPTDYNQVKDLYSLSVLCKQSLSPGQSMTCSHSEKDIEYDSSTVDSHNLEYQKEYKCFQFMVVISGTMGHDTSADQQTLMEAGVDVQVSDTYIVKYNAGVNISYSVITNSMNSAFTNQGVQSHQPIPSNIGFSGA